MAPAILILRDKNLWTIRPDGSGLTKLTKTGDVVGGAEFSPDGQRVALGRKVGTNLDVYVMQADGTSQKRLTTSPSAEYAPTWSPDGRQLAILSTKTGIPEVYRISATAPTTAPIRVTPRAWCAPGERNLGFRAPAWSPTAAKIIVLSRCEDTEVTGYTFEQFLTVSPSGGYADGTYVSAMGGDSPAWFPNGRDFVFTGTGYDYYETGWPPCLARSTAGTRDEYTYLTTCFSDDRSGYAESPAVSPDGQTIAYTCARTNVCLISATGTNQRTIAKAQAVTLAMDWR